MKQWSLDARSEGWFGYSLGDEAGGAKQVAVGPSRTYTGIVQGKKAAQKSGTERFKIRISEAM